MPELGYIDAVLTDAVFEDSLGRPQLSCRFRLIAAGSPQG